MRSISVILLTYNHGPFIDAALDSILSQHLESNWKKQLIVADDASTDGTQRKIENKLEKFEKIGWEITLLMNNVNVGAHANVRAALGVVKGDFLAFIEGDDYWINDSKLSVQLGALEKNPRAVVVCGMVDFVNKEGQKFGESCSLSESLTLKDLCQRNFIYTTSVLYRFDRNVINADWVFSAPVIDWCDSLYHAQRGTIIHINMPLAAYRVHSGGMWSGLGNSKRLEQWLKVIDVVSAHLPGEVILDLNYNRKKTLGALISEKVSCFEWSEIYQLSKKYFKLESSPRLGFVYYLASVIKGIMPNYFFQKMLNIKNKFRKTTVSLV